MSGTNGTDTASRVRELEIKVTFLENHVEEQDRAMLEHFRQIERLQREVKRLAGALASRSDDGTDRLPDNEKPPHY
ncbi:MAG: SlyX family protein [Puniceicoccales bacterium]|jgi:uncharacterized coiled-coil protein SlyX|nr:SlyX family protein [Puniceicoccales bacterium]